MKLTRAVQQQLLDLASAAHPQECCGLLLGAEDGCIDALSPSPNCHPTPETAFEIDAALMIRAFRAAREGNGGQVLGYYHSHPNGNPAPSATDKAQAPGDDRLWAIIAKGQIQFWRDTPADGFIPVECTVIG